MKQSVVHENKIENSSHRERRNHTPLLQATKVSKQYGGSKVLNNVSLNVEAGETLVILAKNKLSDHFAASPAISNGRFYLRGFANFYAIGTK